MLTHGGSVAGRCRLRKLTCGLRVGAAELLKPFERGYLAIGQVLREFWNPLILAWTARSLSEDKGLPGGQQRELESIAASHRRIIITISGRYSGARPIRVKEPPCVRMRALQRAKTACWHRACLTLDPQVRPNIARQARSTSSLRVFYLRVLRGSTHLAEK